MKNILLVTLLAIPFLFSAQSRGPGQPPQSAEQATLSPETEGISAEYWIAPNPSSDFLNFFGKQTDAQTLQIRVYNMVGRELRKFEVAATAGEINLREDASTWLAGTYLVRVEDDGKVLKTMRFVKR